MLVEFSKQGFWLMFCGLILIVIISVINIRQDSKSLAVLFVELALSYGHMRAQIELFKFWQCRNFLGIALKFEVLKSLK